jgi:hypothetical protein
LGRKDGRGRRRKRKRNSGQVRKQLGGEVSQIAVHFATMAAVPLMGLELEAA